MSELNLNIIVPVHNEQASLSEFITRSLSALEKEKLSYRFIFVNDHSTDESIDEIKNAVKKWFPDEKFIKSRRRTKYGNVRFQASKHAVIVWKVGPNGRATSILLGGEFAEAPYSAIIDADLSYPPEAIIPMYLNAKDNGMVVANRTKLKTSLVKKIKINIHKLFLDKVLHKLKSDSQSTLKVFKTDLLSHLSESDTGKWAIDIPLIKTAFDLGHEVHTFDVEYTNRKHTRKTVKLTQKSVEIPWKALKLRVAGHKIYQIKSTIKGSMENASIIHKGSKYVTHTHLPLSKSAVKVLETSQTVTIIAIVGVVILGLILNAKLTTITIIALLSFIYFADILFSLFTLLKSLHFPPELSIPESKINQLNEQDLPIYSVLVPLYKEASVLPHLMESMNKMDWPKDKLDVILLLEENDQETIDTAKSMDLPDNVRVLIVPDSNPKTKPKACNFGLNYAKGEFVVVYDAEDKPDPLQLKKAYIGFKQLGYKYTCIQSKLNYYNSDQNLLTRLFTAEYSLWFDLILPGLQSIETTIPLGGTSNHFRTADLKRINGWDPFNVTEDCDLGVRLFKLGKKTAIIDSVTLEEANSKFGNWLRQRSRWLKGYFQTYFVHMRNPIEFVREHGLHALVFQLVIGLRISFILINPLLWAMTISYFTLYEYVGPQIQALFPPVVFYVAIFSTVFGNFMYLYNYMIGAAKRGTWGIIKYIFFVPFYWLMTSWAALIAFYQLIVKPHYWEKTVHGLNLQSKEIKSMTPVKKANYFAKIADSGIVGGGFLIGANVLASAANFLYNAYLGREVDLEEFGTISLISNIFAITSIATYSLSTTVSHKTAILLGKFNLPISNLWKSVRSKTLVVTIAAVVLWAVSVPVLMKFFNTSDPLPFLLFTPIWFGIVNAVDKGFLNGNLKFMTLALISILEAGTKLSLAFYFTETGNIKMIYSAIPVSVFVSFLVTWVIVKKFKSNELPEEDKKDATFPIGFFGYSIVNRISQVAFMSFDVVLAKHFLSPQIAGQYALLSLSGKIIYFLGGLFSQFVTPLISKSEGGGKNSYNLFYKLFLATSVASITSYILIGSFGYITIPFLFGEKSAPILSYLPIYGIAMVNFGLATTIIEFHQVKKQYLFPVLGLFAAIAQVVGIYFIHGSITDFVKVMLSVSAFLLLAVVILHVVYDYLKIIGRNFQDLLGLFSPNEKVTPISGNKLRILIYNWRDTKHKWAGGAEVYIQEIGKRWVQDGHSVTIFCGNVNGNARFETIDRVNIVRRGGFYMVYFWAVMYYIFRFRGKYDIIVDCENAIPFFTPLFSRIPKVLLIHHIHSEVFRKHLMFPFSYLALFLESHLMPLVYKNVPIITVSESSKRDILKLALRNNNVYIAHPGVKLIAPEKIIKTNYPSFVYIGRLQHYKNIDIAIKAFAKVAVKQRNAIFNIAGYGESGKSLYKLIKELGLQKRVRLLGKVSDRTRNRLYEKSWAALQPSSFEGWGITTIEANTFSTPVIASDVNGLRDSVKDGQTGLLVPAKDINALAEAMEKIITDNKLRYKLSKGAKDWSEKFRWRNSAKIFMNVFNKELTTPVNLVEGQKAYAYAKKNNG